MLKYATKKSFGLGIANPAYQFCLVSRALGWLVGQQRMSSDYFTIAQLNEKALLSLLKNTTAGMSPIGGVDGGCQIWKCSGLK